MASNIEGMDELRRKLRSLVQRAGKTVELKVGFIGGTGYPNGMTYAQVAYINEFGTAINKPERMTVTYRSIRKDGTFNRKGRFVKKSASNFAMEHIVPAHTIIIPARPFMRPVIEAKKVEWHKEFATLLRQTDLQPRVALKQLGEKMVNDVQASIRSVTEPPNAPSTIRQKKGRDKPLENTGDLLRAVTFEVVE